ncbi:hypothetical protein [Bifidobacterium aemilianum]|uniref:hypothetical protein n=1 Tax=Bifidobacterium aemilianum TaxID=2493120 RepID=UPI001F168641|nr:hypothetical protein [Bifidobacterium aemilianum]
MHTDQGEQGVEQSIPQQNVSPDHRDGHGTGYYRGVEEGPEEGVDMAQTLLKARATIMVSGRPTTTKIAVGPQGVEVVGVLEELDAVVKTGEVHVGGGLNIPGGDVREGHAQGGHQRDRHEG